MGIETKSFLRGADSLYHKALLTVDIGTIDHEGQGRAPGWSVMLTMADPGGNFGDCPLE